MKISKRTREQATLLLALAAVSAESCASVHMALYHWRGESGSLADAVWRATMKARLKGSERLRGLVPDDHRYRLSCIEGARLLCAGWSP